MSVDPTQAGAANIIERAKNILLTPTAEWDRIAAEPADVNKLYLGYVLPLALIGAVAGFIGMSLIGASAFGISYRVPMVAGIVTAAVQVAGNLICIYLIAVIAKALAPSFGSQPDQGQAHKLMAYSFTAALLAGIFAIFPPLGMLSIVGLYSFVLLYLGLPRLMKTPEDKRIGYFAVLVIIGIVTFIVIGYTLGAVRVAMGGAGAGMGAFSMSQAAPAPRGQAEGRLELPGGGAIDLGELEKLGQTYAQGAAAGGVTVEPSRLQAFLPPALPGGFALVSQSSASAMGAAQAEAVYERAGGGRLTVTVAHLGPMGAMTGLVSAANVQETREDSDGYSRTRTVNGRIVSEEVSRSSGTASYSVVGRGVAVTAEGYGGVDGDAVRGAVEAVGVERLERELTP